MKSDAKSDTIILSNNPVYHAVKARVAKERAAAEQRAQLKQQVEIIDRNCWDILRSKVNLVIKPGAFTLNVVNGVNREQVYIFYQWLSARTGLEEFKANEGAFDFDISEVGFNAVLGLAKSRRKQIDVLDLRGNIFADFEIPCTDAKSSPFVIKGGSNGSRFEVGEGRVN